MITDSKTNSIIEKINDPLNKYLKEKEHCNLHDIKKGNVIKRKFSSVVFLDATTSKGTKRMVMKTIAHHSNNLLLIESKNQAVVEFDILNFLDSKFKPIPHCSVPTPIIVLPESETYVMEFVEGENLASFQKTTRFFSSMKEFTKCNDYYYNLGMWLKNFHQFTGITTSDISAFDGILERLETRLDLITKSNDPRLPHNFKGGIMNFVNEQLKQVKDDEIIVTGRHGDFGPWNVIVNEQTLTVIDFFGYEQDLLPIDLLKIYVVLEDERLGITTSSKRINELRRKFLEGYGEIPKFSLPLLRICESLYRVISLGTIILDAHQEKPHHYLENNFRLKIHLRWFKNGGQKVLWPNT